MYKLIAGGFAGYGAACLTSKVFASKAENAVFHLGAFGFTATLIAFLVIGAIVFHRSK